MGILSALGFTENKNEKRARNSMDAATTYERQRADYADETAGRSRNRYTDLLQGFDPQKYARETAGALAQDAGEAYNQGQGQLALRAQRSGFINSGGGQGALNRDTSSRLARALAGLSMQAGQMEQGRIDRFGDLHQTDVGVSENQRDRSLDLLAGNRDAAIQSRNSRLQGTTGVLKAATRFLPF